jgi:hypothetical protein
LRCATWLGILFGIEENAVFSSYDIDEATTKLLVILTKYSIVHEIHRNFKNLLREAEKSLMSGPDPESVACALEVVYSFAHTRLFPSGTNTSKAQVCSSVSYLSQESSSNFGQDKFLKGFHNRGGYALKNLKRARKLYNTHNCKPRGEHILLRKDLIAISRELDPVMHLTFENGESGGLLPIHRIGRSFLPQRNQSQILDASISSWDRLRYSSEDLLHEFRSESSASNRSHLSEENLRRLTKGKSAVGYALDDSISQFATTYMDSTTIMGDHVSASGDNCTIWQWSGTL